MQGIVEQVIPDPVCRKYAKGSPYNNTQVGKYTYNLLFV